MCDTGRGTLPALCRSHHLGSQSRLRSAIRDPRSAIRPDRDPMLDVHVVTHTHWDREWYHPVERFRQRLIALVDELLDDPPAGDESFLLDGQAIVLEDYLAVRPDRLDDVRALLAARRLEAGPWYVLADELIPSGEAIVRNLFAGRRALNRLGAVSPPVLYCPDSFGHPAALPAIAAGFGLPLTILWRGLGGARAPSGDTFRWSAPDGSEVLVYHLPRDGYEYGSHLPIDDRGAMERWARMRGELVPRSTTGVLLIPNGADHHARQRDFRDALTALEGAGLVDGVHRSSLAAFAERLVARVGSQRIPLIKGELRDSYGYTWTLQGTFATRAHEKRMNAHAERALLREAEPWAALASVNGASRRALLDAAWKTLLEAHPHDTLCGCSIDDVAAAMELRIRSAHNQADGIRDDATLALIGHDSVVARTARDRWTPLVIVRNSAARKRGGVALIDVEEFVADIGVGPGSAPTGGEVAAVQSTKPVIDGLGALQVLSRRVANSRTESPRHYPDNDLVTVTRVAVWVDDTPGYGLVAHRIGGEAKRARVRDRVEVGGRSLSNAALSISVDDHGSIAIEQCSTGRRIASLIELLDEGDVGDTYTPAPRPREHTVQLRRVRRVHRGPLVGALALDYRISSAGAKRADVELEITLELRAGESFLRASVVGENHRENHRVRLRVHGDVVNGAVWADAAFGPVKRVPLEIGARDAEMEHSPTTAPLHRYVSSFNERVGLTVLSDGLAEYEPFADGGFAVTLVRSVGELSRNDLPERPGHAGWPTPTPGAQCIGPFAGSFGILLHGARVTATIDQVESASDDFLSPLIGTTLRSALDVPQVVRGVELIGAGLAFSSLKESEDGAWLALRCINLRDEPTDGEWRLPFEAREAQWSRIDETGIKEVVSRGGGIRFSAGPRAIVTILVR